MERWKNINIYICLEIIKAACNGNGSTEVIKELLDAGANIEERSLSGRFGGRNYIFCPMITILT